MELPGMCCRQEDISDSCRGMRGDYDVIKEVLEQVETALANALGGYPQGAGHKFHAAVTVEIAQPKAEQSKNVGQHGQAKT